MNLPMKIGSPLAVVGIWLQLLTYSQYNLPHVWVAPGLLLAALAENETRRSPERVVADG